MCINGVSIVSFVFIDQIVASSHTILHLHLKTDTVIEMLGVLRLLFVQYSARMNGSAFCLRSLNEEKTVFVNVTIMTK